MKRDVLIRILTKAHIKGSVDRAILYFKNTTLHCDFVSNDHALAGNVIIKNFGENFIGTEKIGIPDLDSFIKKVSNLGETVEISIGVEGRAFQVLELSDGFMSMKHNLIANSQLPGIPKPKPDVLTMTPCTYYMDAEFVERFYKLSSAVHDCKYLFVASTGNNLNMYFSQSTDFSTGVLLECNVDSVCDSFEMIGFDINKLKTVLRANKPKKPKKSSKKKIDELELSEELIDRICMNIHPSGIINIQCVDDEMKCNYYLVAEK